MTLSVHPWPRPAAGRRGLLLVACGLALAGAPLRAAAAEDASTLVPVHAVLPRATPFSPDLALTGEIQARVQSNVSFRLTGKVTERRVEVGQHVTADEVLAMLDPSEQQADVDNASAALRSAQAALQQASVTFERQKTLIDSGYTTRTSFDQAQESFKTTKAQVDAALAALDTAKEQLSFTRLTAGVNGIVVSRDVEVGQVVQSGATVFGIAEDGARDAVFNIFEALLTKPPKSRVVDVSLQSDPAIRAVGEVRETSPIVDASTGTVKVKIGLSTTPPQMTLGAAVVGRARWDQRSAMVLPWSALFEWQGKPAVWLLDDADVVSPQPIEVAAYATGVVILSGGLDGRRRVVTAGIQLLHPGQKVLVVEGGGL